MVEANLSSVVSSEVSDSPETVLAKFSAAFFSKSACSITFLSFALSSRVFFESTASFPFSYSSSGLSVSSSFGLAFSSLLTSSAVVSSTIAAQSTP
jgi:hypothetical protein